MRRERRAKKRRNRGETKREKERDENGEMEKEEERGRERGGKTMAPNWVSLKTSRAASSWTAL